jgi:bifunctional non-homologous end joining protein LigD
VGRAADRSADAPVVAGVRITHPDKLMFPELGVSKLDIARYYERVAHRMLPHLAGRPLMLLFCPTGVGEGCRGTT